LVSYGYGLVGVAALGQKPNDLGENIGLYPFVTESVGGHESLLGLASLSQGACSSDHYLSLVAAAVPAEQARQGMDAQ
jgi:hypothetical protein